MTFERHSDIKSACIECDQGTPRRSIHSEGIVASTRGWGPARRWDTEQQYCKSTKSRFIARREAELNHRYRTRQTGGSKHFSYRENSEVPAWDQRLTMFYIVKKTHDADFVRSERNWRVILQSSCGVITTKFPHRDGFGFAWFPAYIETKAMTRLQQGIADQQHQFLLTSQSKRLSTYN